MPPRSGAGRVREEKAPAGHNTAAAPGQPGLALSPSPVRNAEAELSLQQRCAEISLNGHTPDRAKMLTGGLRQPNPQATLPERAEPTGGATLPP